MAYGNTLQITHEFIQRRFSSQKIDVEGPYSERIAELKNRKKNVQATKPHVVILGAGPAGLMRALQAISHGNPTTIIEKRGQNSSGRKNTVAITKDTLLMLKYCGIYQYLMEQQLIFPPNPGGYVSVRLMDLERATKAILEDLNEGILPIHYQSQVTTIQQPNPQKIRLHYEKMEQNNTTSCHIDCDIVVNAEGSHSHTNTLLHNNRIPSLPEVPVIAAIYSKPTWNSFSSFFSYIGYSLLYLAATVYYHVRFFFKYLTSSPFRKHFKGALALNTPGQTYLGCAFSKEISAQLRARHTALQNAQSNHSSSIQQLEAQYRDYAEEWIQHALCFSNLISLKLKFSSTRGQYLALASHGALTQFQIVPISADYAEHSCIRMGEGVILMAGDACATVDPTTGLGCNTAIQTSTAFLDFLWDYKKADLEMLTTRYNEQMGTTVQFIQSQSRQARKLYQPEHSMLMQMPQPMYN